MVTPYQESDLSKKDQVAMMFNKISGTYDFLNHFLSFGIDKYWRSVAIKKAAEVAPKQILDIATGTADLAIKALDLNPAKIVGVDISEKMLEIGREKVKKKGKQDKITLELGDSENLKYEDNCFDVVTAAFGVRNFENLETGIKEMLRVLKPGGKLVILEFSNPPSRLVKKLYDFYSYSFMPALGKILARDREAYQYLPDSVKAFPYGRAFTEKLDKCGFEETAHKALTFGIVSVYTGKKPTIGMN